MTQAANIPGIEKATGMPWKEWVAYLDGKGAKNLPHRAVADIAYEKLKSHLGESAGWWSQSVTVAYEQHIGRRKPGQRSDGFYETSVTKTMDGSMDDAMRAWLKVFDGAKSFAGTAIAKAPTSSQTDKRRHWACGLGDGSRVNVDVYPKTAGKALLSITHAKLTSQKAADTWRVHWKAVLEKLA